MRNLLLLVDTYVLKLHFIVGSLLKFLLSISLSTQFLPSVQMKRILE
uniref:Transmembrane protein n=1 Tax=Medicago truncatula TaxID=3880 RepID=I3SJB3_MEDTR|nr:unknown [Medicago truncatula]